MILLASAIDSFDTYNLMFVFGLNSKVEGPNSVSLFGVSSLRLDVIKALNTFVPMINLVNRSFLIIVMFNPLYLLFSAGKVLSLNKCPPNLS